MTLMPRRQLENRITCCIAGCACSIRNRPGYVSWICRKHWRSVDRSLRDKHKLARRHFRTLRRRSRHGFRIERDDIRAAIEAARDAWRAVVEDAVIKAAFKVAA